MRPVEIVMGAFTILLITTGAASAQQASFAGRWVLAPDPAPTAQRGGRPAPANQGTGWGSDLTITQDATTLTIEYARFGRGDMQPPTKLVYRLDGSESRNTVNVGRGPQEQVSRARWEGDRLILTTVHRFTVQGQAMTSETTRVLSLESPASLAIETTYSAVMGGPSSTVRSVYKKS
jgi:hypothetical protein